MELVRRIFKRRPKSIAQVQARELEAPELVLTEGKPLVEAAHDYVRNHEALTPLLNELHAVSGREKWLRKSEQGDKWNRCLIEGMIVLSETGARDEQTTPP